MRSRVNQHRAQLKDTVEQIKLMSACEICGARCPLCLDFHHLDPKAKDLDIAVVIHNAWCLDRLLCEIEKCVVLCSCCHRKVHAGLVSLDLTGV